MPDKHLHRLGLTEQQIAAVRCKPGPVMVIAGAGSGKTSVIANRFIYLNTRYGIDPSRILCVTFTNQAVRNLRERIMQYVPVNLIEEFREKTRVVTFHALCKQILIDMHEKGGTSLKTFIHSYRLVSVVKEILQDYEGINASYQVCRILEKLRWVCKAEGREFTEEDLVRVGIRNTDISDGEKLLRKFPYREMKEIYERFDDRLEENGWMTIDDIILDAKRHLTNREVLNEWCAKFDAILCDEFQDVDDVQFDILTKLCTDDHNLFCVGDPDQSIYGFRGALPRIFKRLRAHFDGVGVWTQIKKLEKNFRSTPEILRVANKLINCSDVQDDMRKDLFTDNGSGPVPTVDVSDSPIAQAEKVVGRIRELQSKGVKLHNIAVLGRNKSHYLHVKNAFLKSSIGYEDWREVFSLVGHMEIKDLIAWISVGFVRDDNERWASFLKRVYSKPGIGVGPKTFGEIIRNGPENIVGVMEEMAKKSAKVALLLKKIRVLQRIADDESKSVHDRCVEIANVSGLIKYYSRGSQEEDGINDRLITIKNFLDSPMVVDAVSWDEALSHVEKYLHDDTRERLICSTIHGVKGLEFEHVFLVSLSNGNIPSRRGLKICKTEEERNAYIEEERRLMYVACTRAKKTLHLFTDKPQQNWSHFLDDIIDCVELGEMDESGEDVEMVFEEEEDETFYLEE